MDDAPRRLIFNAEQSGDEALAIPSRDPVVRLTLASDAPETKKVPRQSKAIPAGLPDNVEQPDPFGSAIDWAFRRYDVSLNTSAEGQVFQSSLYLFNLIVALEWRPDEEYMQMLRSTFTRASDLLFDVTDGWMAFGQVVFGGPELMDCADIQIMASNRLFPRSWVAGLHIDHKYMPIRAGRGLWNDNRRGVIAWEEPEGYRTLIHEWCHYALCLTDEYLESRPVVLPEQVRRPADHLSLVQAPITSLVMPSVRSFSESIMATTEGTSELVSKQWPKLAERFPAVPPDRTDRQVLAGPRWLPAALPRFRRQGSLAGGAADPSISLPAWRELRGELAGLGVSGELKLDRCWVYVLRDAASAAEPARVIAQGTLEASSEDAAFPLLGAHDRDTVALIVERRGDRPTVLRARVAGDRPEGWGATNPTAFPEIDIVPEPADTNDSKAAIRLRVGGAANLPDQIEIFPLGYDRPVTPEWQSGTSQEGWVSKPLDVPTLDGHVLVRWGQGAEQILISSFSQGGSPPTTNPFPANPISAGSSDGGAMLFFLKGADNTSTYGHIKVITTIAHGMGGTPEGWRERGYAYGVAGNAALPVELTPTLVLYYDPVGPDEEGALADGDLRICRWIEGGWRPLPTYVPPGYRFAVTPLSRSNAGSLVAPKPQGARVEYYRVYWVPRES